MITIVLICVVILAYAYIGYPLFLGLIGSLYRGSHRISTVMPSVTMIIVARNESESIEKKLSNCYALDYPQDRLEILVASDDSNDQTDAIVKKHEAAGRCRLVQVRPRSGKTGATNEAVKQAKGEVLLFSDATGMYHPNAVKKLVRHFADPHVGCVTGKVVYHYTEGDNSVGFRMYQRLLNILRAWEATVKSQPAVSGSIYLVRRSCFRFAPLTQSYDLYTPLSVAMEGLWTLRDPEAISYEQARPTLKQEYASRIRAGLVAFTFVSVFFRHMMRFRSPIYIFQVASHKILRWFSFVPLALLITCGSVLAIQRFGVVEMLLVGLGVFAIGRWAVRRFACVARAWHVIHFALAIQIAFAVAFARYLIGHRAGMWEPIR